MSSPLTFASVSALSAELQSFIEDTGAEFTGDINTIIKLGESRCYTDLQLETLDTVLEYQILTINPIQPIKPADHLAIRSLHWRPGANTEGAPITGAYSKIARRTYEFCLQWADNPASTTPPTESPASPPLYFCEYSPTEVYFAPAPNTDDWIVMRHIVRPPSIVDGATWLASNCGELLLYGCLISSEQFLKADDSFVARWTETYQGILALRRFELRDSIRADYSPVKPSAAPVGQAA